MYTALDRLAPGERGHVAAIDWDRLSPADGRRLRELGLMEGARVELLHRGSLFLKDPIAVRVGRTRIALRSAHAAAVAISEDGMAEAGDGNG